MKNNAGYCPQKPNFSEENFALLAHSQRRSKLGLGGPNARQQQPEVKSPLENVETGNKLIRYCCLFQCHSLLLYNNKRCFKIDLFKRYLINLFFFFFLFFSRDSRLLQASEQCFQKTPNIPTRCCTRFFFSLNRFI